MDPPVKISIRNFIVALAKALNLQVITRPTTAWARAAGTTHVHVGRPKLVGVNVLVELPFLTLFVMSQALRHLDSRT